MQKNFLTVEIRASQMKDEPKAGRQGCGVVIAAAGAITVLAGVRKQIEQASERRSHRFCASTHMVPEWSTGF